MDESTIIRAEGIAEFRLRACIQLLLRFLFPTIDWRRVAFFNDIPWWLGSSANAVTLPDGLSYAIHVFFNSRKLSAASAKPGEFFFPYDLDGLCRAGQSAAGLATLVHECIHVLQFQQAGGAGPFGYFRPGTLAYVQ